MLLTTRRHLLQWPNWPHFISVLTLAQIHKLCVHQLDVDNTFLYAPLDKKLFMKPENFCTVWNKLLKLEKCLFILLKEGEIFFVTLYIDYILICANNTTGIKEPIHEHFWHERYWKSESISQNENFLGKRSNQSRSKTVYKGYTEKIWLSNLK